MSQPALWAVYLQMTFPGDSTGETKRKQWVFLPAFNGSLVEPGETATSQFGYFHREQDRLTSRTTWRAYRNQTIERVTSKIEQLLTDGWVADPIITCEVHPRELAEITANWKTPYRVLTRLRRVSDATHRYSI